MLSLSRTTLRSAAVLLLVVGLAGPLGGCDFLDPTEVTNPQTTDDELRDATDPTASLLPGLRAQFSRALSATVVTTEFASDNYSINGTGLGGDDLDFPADVTPGVTLLNAVGQDGMYYNLQELRALADFTIDSVAVNDANAMPEDVAEASYYRGMALLMLGENVVAAPVVQNGTPVPARGLLEAALVQFEDAVDLDGETAQLLAAQARTHRALGNATEAQAAAEDALDAGGSLFLFAQPYDDTSSDATVENGMNDYLVERALQEAQPLPRLDFLDPKYVDADAPIPVASAEEMHLILAEVALSGAQPAVARSHMLDAIDVVDARIADGTVQTFLDTDARLDNNLDLRPQSEEIEIAFEPGAPFVAGLVLDRPATVTTPTVSGTAVTPGDVNGAADGELGYWLYRLRQEILFLEGRRLHDLGIRLPIMLREINASPTIASGDAGTEVAVPSYIPAENEMDLFDPASPYAYTDEGDPVVDDNGDPVLSTTQVTMLHDMNRIVSEQRGLVIDNPLLGGN